MLRNVKSIWIGVLIVLVFVGGLDARSSNEETEKFLNALEGQNEKEGKDNALIYYVRATLNFRDIDSHKNRVFFNKVLEEGWSAVDPEEFERTYEIYRPAIQLIEQGVAVESAGGPECIFDLTQPINDWLATTTHIKAMAADARRLETQGNHDEAVEKLLSVAKLGVDISRSNCETTSFMVAQSIQTTAYDQLNKILFNGLNDEETFSRVIDALERLEAHRGGLRFLVERTRKEGVMTITYAMRDKDLDSEDLPFFLGTDGDLSREERIKSYALKSEDFYGFIIEHFEQPYMTRNDAAFKANLKTMGAGEVTFAMVPDFCEVDLRDRTALAKLRILKTKAALELYRKKTGKYPEKLEELVPDCLRAIPTSPFTASPPYYSADELNYCSGEDPRGFFYAPVYDICIDGPDRESAKPESSRYDPTNGSLSHGAIRY